MYAGRIARIEASLDLNVTTLTLSLILTLRLTITLQPYPITLTLTVSLTCKSRLAPTNLFITDRVSRERKQSWQRPSVRLSVCFTLFCTD